MRLSRAEYEQLLQRHPKLAPDFAALPATVTERPKRRTLETALQREAPSGERFEIVFTIHAFQPCDWDNYHVKELQDMAVIAGILPSDSWDTLSGRVVCKKAASKEKEKTVIEITRVQILPLGEQEI